MDPRNKKPYDFVAIMRNMTEEVQKARRSQINWLRKYEWLLDEHLKLEEEMKKLCEEKRMAVKEDDSIKDSNKSCLPVPITTTGEYGWIAAKPEFQLEKYGPYNPYYPNPLRDVTPLSGDIPTLAAGKSYYS